MNFKATDLWVFAEELTVLITGLVLGGRQILIYLTSFVCNFISKSEDK
jgi:hypothetical protein